MNSKVATNKRGTSLLEVVIALALLGILTIPIFKLYQASITHTRTSSIKLEGMEAGQTIAARIQAAGTTQLDTIPALTQDYLVTAEGQDQYHLVPKGHTDFDAMAEISASPGSDYTIPRVNVDLAINPEPLFEQKQTLQIVSVEMQRSNGEDLGTYLASVIE